MKPTGRTVTYKTSTAIPLVTNFVILVSVMAIILVHLNFKGAA